MPTDSSALLRHRTEDERGLQYRWPPELADVMCDLMILQPDLHCGDPYQALQDQFSTALHAATPGLVEAGDLIRPGPHQWCGRPLWLEFPGGRTYGGVAYEGALVFASRVGSDLMMFGVLMGQTVEQPLCALITHSLQQAVATLAPGDPLRDVLCAVTHVPTHALPAPRHEPRATMEARLERLVARITTLAPGTSASLPRLFLNKRHTWDRGVFVPSELTGMELFSRDGHAMPTALALANEVSLLTAWRFAKHVARIDEDVLDIFRQATLPQHLPGELPGLTSHAVYVPVPGGLSIPQETGLFVGLDETAGQRRLVMLIETRVYGSVQLAPVSLALGTDISAELQRLAAMPLWYSSAARVPQLHARLGLALQCALHLGNPATVWKGPGHPRRLQPMPGPGGKATLHEAKALHIWTVT